MDPNTPPPPHGQPPFPPPPPPRKGMAPWLKVGLIGCGTVFLLFVIAIVILVMNADKVVERTGAVMEEGQAAGRRTDEQGCIDQGKTRVGTGVRGIFSGTMWVQGCLETARETPGFCLNVPRPDEFRENVRWLRAQCPGTGADAQTCQQLMRMKQQFCHSSGRKGVDPAAFDSLNTQPPTPTDAAAPDTAGRF